MKAKRFPERIRITTGLMTLLGQRLTIFYLFHPLVMLLSGYAIVRWTLPVVTKSLLFMLICFVAGWLVYLVMVQPSLSGKKTRSS